MGIKAFNYLLVARLESSRALKFGLTYPNACRFEFFTSEKIGPDNILSDSVD